MGWPGYDLITFGCSYTYGHGLPDCIHDDGTSHGPSPSVLSWPYHLKHNCEFATVDNQAEPGASNKIIARHIVEYKKYSKRSFVVILWTNFDRHTVFHTSWPHDRLHMMPQHLGDMPDAFWEGQRQRGEIKEFKRKTLAYYSDFHSDFDVYFDQVIRMGYIDAWLKSKGITQVRHLFFDKEWIDKLSKEKKYFNKYIMDDMKVKTFNYSKHFKIDNALDKPHPHPGIGSHRLFAMNIQKRFKL